MNQTIQHYQNHILRWFKAQSLRWQNPAAFRTFHDRETTLSMIQKIESWVDQQTRKGRSEGKIVYFSISPHTKNISMNSLVGLLTTWSLRLAGYEVQYWNCHRGLSQCVLGSNRFGEITPPPCDRCMDLRSRFYPTSKSIDLPISEARRKKYRQELDGLSFHDLISFKWKDVEVGRSSLISLRWIRRRLNVEGDEFDFYTMKEFISSAIELYESSVNYLKKEKPSHVFLFNGTFFAEATIRKAAQSLAIPVVTYESGFQKVSAFFTTGIATEYHLNIPENFQLSPDQNRQLDRYLETRFSGGSYMSGRKQWPRMDELPSDLQEKLPQFKRVVSIFTNSVWDTSQAYADRFFSDILEWLELTLRDAEKNPDILFVVRAHPDEARPAKESRETINDFLKSRGFDKVSNIYFIEALKKINSYELVRKSDAIAVYNSTIGLEASILGKYVLCGGWTRYRLSHSTPLTTSKADYLAKWAQLLNVNEPVAVSNEWPSNARRYFYFSLFESSLDFSRYLDPIETTDFALKNFDWNDLKPDNSKELNSILRGFKKLDHFNYDHDMDFKTKGEIG